ncbi:CLUMA_CG021241, isoform A, partial [Clunio marinus]
VSCNDQNIQSLFNSQNVSSTAHKFCLGRKSKVIILLIDALKYDFGVFDENITHPLPYQNKLPIINELIHKHPEKSRFLKLIADPPTTTLQRLKGLTTGSLPTFIDMGSNFATPEINEDNIIDQVHKNNMTAVFLGDSTWIELFPNRFKRKHSYPSFNIHDLDYVDSEIRKHLPEEMKRKDWDLLIAHFLGVDHCGHKYGPLHPEMGRKLREMNEVITEIAHTMDDDTILFVMGDHGMTVTGDHGGDSKDEIESLLFAFSKENNFVPKVYDDEVTIMQQIDLSSTLATILGVPVPFSNLGSIVFQLLPDVMSDDIKSRHQLLAQHLWHNAEQIKHYINTYSEENEKTFSVEDLHDFESKFKVFEKRILLIEDDESFKMYANDLKSYLREILEHCRNAWIKFNPQLMSQGVLTVFLVIFMFFFLFINLPLEDFSKVFNSSVVSFSLFSSFILGSFGFFFHRKFGFDDNILSALFISSLWNILIFIYLLICNWPIIVDQMYSMKRFLNVVPRLTFMLSCLVFFSNSFVVQEQKVLSYMLSTQIIYTVYELKKSTKMVDLKGKFKLNILMKSTIFKVLIASLFSILFIRMCHNYFKCREEQSDCWDYFSATETPTNSSERVEELWPIIILALFVTICRIFLKTMGNLTGFSLHVLLIRFGPMLAVISACGHLILSQRQAKRVIIPQVYLDMLAWIVYGIFIIEIIVIMSKPLLIYIVPRKENEQVLRMGNYNDIIPELFRHVKKVFNVDNTKRQLYDKVPIIYGFATVYSSVFFAFGSILGILLALLLGVDVSNGIILIIAMALLILFIFSVLRFETAANGKTCLEPQFSLIVTWFLLVNFGFYATSHQSTISQIDWKPAFIGRTAYFDHSNFFSALLVLTSTFGSNILLMISYPLLIIFPFTLYSLFPQLSKKVLTTADKLSKEEKNSEYRRITLGGDDVEGAITDFDVTRGEINLYENEKLFLSSTFKVGCQLMILQGIKILCSMLACTILCRHLMVWKIFAPRFIYEVIASYINFISIIVGFIFMFRIHKSVKTLVDKINKKY